jgi:hypothetical protein
LIDALGIPTVASLLDVGGGASLLADRLLERGFRDVTVLDLSSVALERAGHRPGARFARLHEDLLTWVPTRRYDVWHDRALLHFLVDEAERDTYLNTLRSAVPGGGAVIIGAFAPTGPKSCSGLPVVRYEARDLARLIGKGFELDHVRHELHVTPRGVTQPFTWIAGRLADQEPESRWIQA